MHDKTEITLTTRKALQSLFYVMIIFLKIFVDSNASVHF